MSYRKQKKIYKRNIEKTRKIMADKIGVDWWSELFIETTRIHLLEMKLRKKGLV